MEITVGSRVKWSVRFLKSTGLIASDFGLDRGTVTKLAPYDTIMKSPICATILWDKEGESQANVSNLKLQHDIDEP